MNWLTQPLTWPDVAALSAVWWRGREVAWDEWPLWPVWIQGVCAAALLAFSACAVGLLWPSNDAELAQLSATQQALSVQLNQQQARLKDLKSQGLRNAPSEQDVVLVQQDWPTPAQVQSLLIDLTRRAQARDLQMESLKPEALTIHAQWTVQPVSLRLRGSFAQLVAWSRDLFQQSAVWTPEKWTLSAQSDGQVMLDALLHLYLRPEQELALQADSARDESQAWARWRVGQEAPTDPFHRSASTAKEPIAVTPLSPSGHPLQRWPLQSMAMVGIFFSQGSAYGLVQTPGGLFQVTLGDKLGSEEGQVVSLDEARMQVRVRTPQAKGGWQERLEALSITPAVSLANRRLP